MPHVLPTSTATTKLLTDPHYLEIINALHYGDLGVQELAALLKDSADGISARLTNLQHEGIVVTKSLSQKLLYSLADKSQLASLSAILYELWSEALAQPQPLTTVSL